MSIESLLEQLKASYGHDFEVFGERLREIDKAFKDSAKALAPFFTDFKKFSDNLRQIPSHLHAPGSPPFSRTLTRRPIEALRSVHVEAKEVQCRVQAWCG